MTEIYAEKAGDLYTISAKGHAAGSSEVCAAVSAILYALAGYMENAGESIDSILTSMDSGCAVISFRGGQAAEAVFDMAVIGLMQIEAACPKYIRVKNSVNSIDAPL